MRSADAGAPTDILAARPQLPGWSAVQRWAWRDPERRARNLLRFAETEADGGRDLLRAAELTADPRLRRLFLRHAEDEQRHAALFRARGVALLHALPPAARPGTRFDWLTPGERGQDDLEVEAVSAGSLLAFLHLSEKAAAEAFAVYRDALPADDPAGRALFAVILKDEAYHMAYTLAQLRRVAPARRGRLILWRARLARLWKGYLRIAAAIAGLISGVVLTALYLVVLPPFALLARRAGRRAPAGWSSVPAARPGALKRQY